MEEWKISIEMFGTGNSLKPMWRCEICLERDEPQGRFFQRIQGDILPQYHKARKTALDRAMRVMMRQ